MRPRLLELAVLGAIALGLGCGAGASTEIAELMVVSGEIFVNVNLKTGESVVTYGE